MFIQSQDRKTIINTFAVKKFIVTEDNQIHAIMELPTKTKPAVVEVLAEYDSDEKRKAVIKGLMYEMRKREQAFKMPKNHKVRIFQKPPKPAAVDAATVEAAAAGDAAAAAEAPAAAETPAVEAPAAAEAPTKE